MKKALRNIILGTACSALVLPLALPMAACGKANDTEERTVSLALGAVDENFNPFLYTAQNDGEVVGLTQIPLITANSTGTEVACGDNEATVALAYRETMYDANGHVTNSGDTNGSTVYEYVIKKGIKFSDGVDLTIKDVLFNFYVYLDPMYTGSTTLYSTKIKGLASYRAQQDLGEDADDTYTSQFIGEVTQRFNALITYSNTPSAALTETLKDDLILVAEEFEDELNSDWTSNVGTVNSYKENYNFTEDWEVFYFNEGYVGYQTEAGSTKRKQDANGKYLLQFDDGGNMTDVRDRMNAALTDANVKAYASANGLSTEDAKAALMKETAIEEIFRNYITVTRDSEGKITSADRISSTSTKIYELLTAWNTGTSVRQRILNKVMSDKYENTTDLNIKSISGITTYTATASDFSNYTAGSALKSGETYDVLRVEINGVDPAAKWTFGISVAPMHYYSSQELYQKAMNTPSNDNSVSNRFGVQFSNETFFDTVLNAPEKTRKPVGAGAYKSEGNRIYNNNEASYERNEYFETVGSGLNNAKIKYLKYKIVSDDQLMNTLISGGIDFGMPNCTPDNITELNGQRHLTHIQYDSNGFGYVGINPKYVPQLEVRQAIMRAMNVVSITSSYYTTSYASVIYRPISKTSWAYPDGATAYPDVAYTASADEILSYLKSHGCTEKDKLLYDKNGDPLKYTFTIAGESTDHPAYDMFKQAADKLNDIGFEITVQTDVQALAKLATGKLEVWAAAWTSGIDPDMYQVYHKDSKASSVKNWGYDVILTDTTPLYSYERGVINALAIDIENARKTTDQAARKAIYADALNKVMSLAVELPTYQRKDLAVFNNNIIDKNSLNTAATAYSGVLDRIWELDYV